MIKTKSVTSPIDRQSDGLRILATRFRGRGLPTDRYDVWMPSLGPSEELLRKFLAGRISWPTFARAYHADGGNALLRAIRDITTRPARGDVRPPHYRRIPLYRWPLVAAMLLLSAAAIAPLFGKRIS